ncbi:MAG: RecQ family ATP-dependent DNA helicase [Chitinophagales bacterium]|nr:RecQ family ATP-dependent DNA helicase [Chitinophagales bacterium]
MQPTDVLRQYWGYPAFRPAQEQIIQSVLDGKDTLALLPTGGGKSLCYQVPALCQEGLCIVVSPLIALMKDQVANLRNRGIAAAAVFSGLHRREIDIIFENACNGAYKLLYLSPERLQTEIVQARLPRMNVSLLAVDEAHCISQWGYDFRPPYLQIADIRRLVPKTPIIALTATATPDVVKDIQEKLAFRANNVFQQSFARENLSYSVLYEHNKRDKLLDILKKVPGTGVVYARSRGETKELAHFLQKHRISADFYHAGLPAAERSAKQDAWMEGKIRIMVSTNAFGMGIDKSNVRVVAHLHLPESPEAYFQEAGRGGRDGQKAYAVLLYAPADADSLRFAVNSSFPPFEVLRQVYQALGSYTQLAVGAGQGESFDFDLAQFCSTYKLEQSTTHTALKLLEQEGWIALHEAVATATRIHLSASREVLYDYQIRNKQADKVTKVLLRAYPGVNLDLTEVSEYTLAKYAGMEISSLQQVLQTAHNAEILQYFPASDKPQLVFLRPRTTSENLTIDQERFNARKARAISRMEAIISYAETRRCRSKQLLQYFGEKDGAACGICDVCTGRNKSDFSDEQFEAYEIKLKQVLLHEALPLAEVLSAFSSKRHELVAQVIDYLLDEGKLQMDETGKLFF